MVSNTPRTDVKTCPKCGASFAGEPANCDQCGTRLFRVSYQMNRAGQGMQDRADLLFQEGASFFERGQYAEAVARYDKVIAINSRNADAWNARGDALSALGREKDASASYDIARAIRPDTPLVLANRGSMLNDLGRYDDASSCIDRALAMQPDLAEAWSVRGEIFWNRGEYTEALAMFERAIALRPEYADAILFRDMIRSALDSASPEGIPAMDSDDSRYIPAEIKGAIWERDGGRCVICGSWKQLEYDHCIPASRGGDNTMDNIRILCRKCKKRKPGRTAPDEA